MSPRFSIRPLATLADQRLAELAAGGDERAFETLIGRHRMALERYCWRLGLPDHRAEDVLQQAFTSAWISLRRGGEVGQPRAWLYRIVHNAALNADRSARLRTHESIDAPVLGSLALAASDDVETRLRAMDTLREVAALPRMQRRVVVMTALQGRSHEEAAGELGLTDGAVRGLLHRARTKLRAAAAALSPQGLAELLARAPSGGAEAGAGLAGAGLAGVLAKGAAVTAVTALLAGGAVSQLAHDRSHRHRTAVAGATAGAPLARARADDGLTGTALRSRDARHGSPARRLGEDRRGRDAQGGGRGRDGSSAGPDRSEGLRSGGHDEGGSSRGERIERSLTSGEDGGRLSGSGSDRTSGGPATSGVRDAGESAGKRPSGGRPGGDGGAVTVTPSGPAAATLPLTQGSATGTDGSGSGGRDGSSGSDGH